jgi:hypothetical protein
MNGHEPPSPHDRTKGFADDRTSAAIGLLIAGALIFLVVGMVYLDSLVIPTELQGLGQGFATRSDARWMVR